MSTIAPNDANIVYSPYNWDQQATFAKTICAGAYWQTTIVGDITGLTATFNVASMAGYVSRVAFRVDSGAWQDAYVAASVALTLPTNNTWSTHTVEMVVVSTTEISAERWAAPQNTAVVFTGLTTTNTVTLKTPRTAPLIGLAVGDSITEGIRTLHATATPGDTLKNDARTAWAYPLRALLGAEIGVVGFGGVGITKPGSGNVPKFSDNMPFLYSGVARSYTTPKAPDFIVAQIGTNDTAATDALVTTDTTTLLNQWLAATPAATRIFVVGNWLQRKIAPIQSGIASSTTPSRITFVDTVGWWNTADSTDSVHPYGYINTSDLAPRLAAVILANLAGNFTYIRNAAGQAVPIQTTYKG